MAKSRNKRWAAGFFAAGVLFLTGSYAVPGLIGAATPNATAGRCTPRQHKTLARGNPSSKNPWRVEATVEDNNGGCAAWLLSLRFLPHGVERGSWRGSWSIPSGGHLSNTFTIAAADEDAEEARAFSGVVGARVRKIRLITKSGNTSIVHPALPRRQLRKRFVWLRNFRFFMHLYRAGSPVKTAMLLDGRGKVLYTARGFEGVFEGPT